MKIKALNTPVFYSRSKRNGRGVQTAENMGLSGWEERIRTEVYRVNF
jgi:hypothetical protein